MNQAIPASSAVLMIPLFACFSCTAGQVQTLNEPPEGFVALFNGENLDGWKGLVGSPVSRAGMTESELARAQAAADEEMRAYWSVADGVLVFDGGGHSLCTVADYGDFELLVDWKIEGHGDSGIYLRGSPQVQIWDPAQWPVGSGGLYNNQRGPSDPLTREDKPIGEWNTFRIIMRGERVTVYLNDVLVADDVVMENYWERDKPIYPVGQIELQSHSTLLYFRNIFIREIPPEPLRGRYLTSIGPFSYKVGNQVSHQMGIACLILVGRI